MDHITPNTKTRESSEAYARRMNRRGFSQEVQHRSHLKRFGFIALALVLILGIGGAAAYFAYFASVDSKLASSDHGLEKVLTPVQEGAPYYALLCADLNDYDGRRGIDAMLLARVDQSAKQVTLVALPGNVRVPYDNGVQPLSALMDQEGEARVVSSLSTLLGVGISHLLYVDRTAFTSIVDDLGGVEITLEEAVDDPRAGSDYLPTGSQTLNGSQAATLLMAYNYKEGLTTMLINQRRFAVALAGKFFASQGGYSLAASLDALAKHVTTDWNARQLRANADALKGLSSENIYTAQLSGYDTTLSGSDETRVFVPSASDITSLMAAVDAGGDPSYRDQKEAVEVDKDSFEITVRNGSGMTGGASQLAAILTDAGFTVAETGNADSYVYTETLVIYLDPAYKTACEAVVQALDTGRVVNGLNGYVFDTEVLVVLGSDWKPLS